MAPKKHSRHTRSNPDPNPPAVFENPNIISNILRKQEQQEDFADTNPEAIQPSEFSTPIKVLFHSSMLGPYTTSVTPYCY